MKKRELAKPVAVDFSNRPPLRGIDMHKLILRPGSLDILAKPSRMGSTLFYPDGRREVAR